MIFTIKKRKEDFSIFQNKLLRREGLSFGATATLCYLLSFPDNWEVRLHDIKRRFICGTFVVQRIFRELSEKGYARLVSISGPKGTWIGKRYFIYEQPKAWLSDDAISRLSANRPVYLKNTIPKKKTIKEKASQPVARHLSLIPPSLNGTFPKTTAGKLCQEYYDFLVEHRLLPKKPYKGRMITIRPVVKNWIAACQEILSRIEWEELQETMQWYFDHYQDPYVTTHKSFSLFCIHYDTIRKAMCRTEGFDPSKQVNTYEGENFKVTVRSRK